MKRTYSIVIIIFLILFLTLFIVLSVFTSNLFSKNFYQKEYEENGVYVRYGKENVDNYTESMFSYFKNKDDFNNHSILSSRDIRHMYDVKIMIKQVIGAYYLALFAVVACLIGLFFIDKDRFFRNCSTALICTGAILVVIGILTVLLSSNFGNYFYDFHTATFDNDLWQLDPAKDTLINLYPESFFYNFVKQTIIYSVINGIILIIAGIAIRLFVKSRLCRTDKHQKL